MMSVADNITSVLDYIFQKLGIVFDWTADSILPYIKEAIGKYASWKVYENTFGICIGAFSLLLGIAGIIVNFVLVNKYDFDEDWYFFDWLWGTLCFAGVIVIPICVCSLIKVYNFPELAFTEWIVQLLQTTG